MYGDAPEMVSNAQGRDTVRWLGIMDLSSELFFSDLKQTSSNGCFKASKMEKVIKEIVDGG